MIQPLALLSRKSRLAVAVLAPLAVLSGSIYPTAVAASAAQSAERTSYVLLSPGGDSSTMSGSMEDLDRAKALRSGREGLLYFRQGGAAYVIRDAETLRRAHAVFEPQRALGARQAELGSRQAALGRQQAALGAQQARLGIRQANATSRQQGELGRQQGELGRQQHALGQQQHELGRQQSALGREQHRSAFEAEAKLRVLLAEALQRGVAQRVG